MKGNIEEEKTIKYYQNKEISFSVDFDTKKLLEALGITEEDSFENHQIRFKTLLNLIEKLQKENEELKDKWDKDTHKLQNDLDIANAKRIDWEKAYQEEKDKQFELLRENQKLQKKNEELKEAVEIYKGQVETKIDAYIDSNYLSKQKIKDKIEELKEEYKTELEKNSTRAFILKCQITILEDLLEEKGE